MTHAGREKILQQIGAVHGQETLGMKLEAIRRVLSVADAHDFLLAGRRKGPRVDFEFFRERVRLDDQRVVSRRHHRIGKPVKEPGSVVVDIVGFAVHQAIGSHDFPTSRLTNRLMPKAHAK